MITCIKRKLSCRGINEWGLRTLMQIATCNQTKIGMVWHPARPKGYAGLAFRLRCAWAVFNGKADIVYWPGEQ